MAELTNPTDIARETLKLLAVQRIPPTPQNYQRLYHEISRTQPPENGVSARLIGILRELSSRNPEDTALTGLVRAVERHDWEDVSRDLQRLCERATGYTTTEWASLIRDLVRQLELPHRGITAARKREGLERLLTGSSGSEVPLPQRMRALIRSWSDAGASAMADTQAGQAGAVPPTGQTLSGGTPSPLATHGASKMVVEIRDLLASTLENGVGPRLDRYSDVQSELVVLAQKIREASMPEDWSRIAALLKQFWIKIELRLEPEEEILDNLLRLLGLMVNNLGELVDDDQWVNGQVAVLRELINRPMDLRAVREAERGFKEVIYKQASLKASLREAKSTLKNLLSVFVERLSSVTENTVDYHGRIEVYAERIASTDSMDSLRILIDDLMADTRGMQVDMLRSRDQLLEARRETENAQGRVQQLENELQRISEQVREDQLTGALNRRGMEDAMTREIARAQRSQKPLCLAVLDVDNFKRLNDTHGHAAGDAALVHLARAIRHTVRPTDIIARYGGEEFVIILSDTEIDEAVRVISRLQRELTKKFFLHDNERLLVTFSAGVAEYRGEESEEAVLQRADKAMYQAKLQGKNRVVQDTTSVV